MLSSDAIGLTLAAGELPGWLTTTAAFIKVLIGFSIIIFVHELGHFLAAKWVGIRVDRFSVGFGPRLFGFRRGEGFTLGRRPDYSTRELSAKGYGETDYCFKALPIGGYVKMLGQDDVVINEQTGEVKLSDDPRAFTNKPVGKRMVVVSAGVVFNLLFAALLLVAVFLIGLELPAPEIGVVHPDSPAQGKLLPGDRVLEINGRRVDSFADVRLGVALADGDVRFRIARGGRTLDEEVVVTPVKLADDELQTIDVDPVLTTRLVVDGEQIDDLPNLRQGDEITHVNGQPVSNALDILALFSRSAGAVLELTVRRPLQGATSASGRAASAGASEGDSQRFEVVRCYQRAVLSVKPADLPAEARGNLVDSCHILGLRRRRVVGMTVPGMPAEKAGFQRGDVIAAWGTVLNPTYQEIIDSIQANAGKPIPVIVLRNGRELTLSVTPRRKFRLFGQRKAEVGIEFSARGEEATPVVADVVPGTPFAALNMPRGALLLAIDGRPVANWFDVVEALKAAAGRTVAVRYRSAGDEETGTVTVPGSLVNELGLPPGAVVWSVDGEKSVTVPNEQGQMVTLPVLDPRALRQILLQKIGQTVTVRYSASLAEPVIEASFTVRPDTVDPWQMRVTYGFDPLAFEPKTVRVSAHGNPLTALKLGVNYAGYQLWQVYVFLNRLASRRVSTQNVAGPIGIIGMAMERAQAGLPQLMFFLAFLSVNLAVINFLPMPVMDGGLMIFLLIEKIKGKPLSLKAQMISTMVGLVAIILVGLYVTIQDIGRFF